MLLWCRLTRAALPVFDLSCASCLISVYVRLHAYTCIYVLYVCMYYTHTLSLSLLLSLSLARSLSLSLSLALALSLSLARSLSLSLSQQARDARATKTHATKSKAVLPFASTPSSLPSYVSPLLNSPAGSASICIIHTLFICAADDHASAGRRPGRSIYVYYCTAGPAKKLCVEVRGQVVLVVQVACTAVV